MIVSHKNAVQTISGYHIIDSLIINNYGNKFNLNVAYECFNFPNILSFGCQFPTYDHNNKRLSLSINNDDPTTTKYENQLKNDTIILYFNMDNIAFYAQDGVPYYSSNIKQIAVKQY